MKIEARKTLSRREFGLLLIQQEGKCPKCGTKLDFTKPRQVIDEHLRPLREGGSNELHNRQLWCKSCASHKTHKIEAPARAKAARYEDGRTQADLRKQNGSQIQSRGFQKPPEGFKHSWGKRKLS
jgi:5-methylcytosine-specific restriction endonuclease McrA